jgi:hypothetical protein
VTLRNSIVTRHAFPLAEGPEYHMCYMAARIG